MCGEVVCVPTQVLTSLLPISLLFVYIAPLRTLQACYLSTLPSNLTHRPCFLLSGLSSLSSFLLLLFLSCRLSHSFCFPSYFLPPVSSFLLPAFCSPCYFLTLIASFLLPAFCFLCFFPSSYRFFPSPCLLLPLLFPSSHKFFPSPCILLPLLFPSSFHLFPSCCLLLPLLFPSPLNPFYFFRPSASPFISFLLSLLSFFPPLLCFSLFLCHVSFLSSCSIFLLPHVTGLQNP